MDKHYKDKRLEKWYAKNGVDPDRLNYLKEELNSIEKKIRQAEG
jgi:hypothetical protein